MANDEIGCMSCRWRDEYFGDCCHPKGGGCEDVRPSIDNCLEKNHAWFVPIVSTKFWNHIEEALNDIENVKSYYVGGTLCIDFSIKRLIGLNLDGTGFTPGGKLYQPKHIHKLVIETYRKLKGETDYFKKIVNKESK